ncbi:hypothetical protein V2G26_005838 [Clonostachys chloroleuca]
MYRNWNNESMWDDPTWQNFTATFNEGTASLFNESFSDWAISNNTLTLDNEGGASKSYYWNTFPRELLSFTFIAGLMYLWDIWLEDLLPTRPRGVGADAKTEKAVYPNEPKEETLGRSIVKSGARRASISWRNTFLKWLMDIVFGTMWKSAVSLVIGGEALTIDSFLIETSIIGVTGFIHLSYIVSFIAFIAIPVPQRPLFRTSADALASILYTSLSKIAIAQFLKSAFGQRRMMRVTESLRSLLVEQEKTRQAHFVDEL